jgi:hypothetical protein
VECIVKNDVKLLLLLLLLLLRSSQFFYIKMHSNAAMAEATKPRSNLTIICQQHDMIHLNGQQWSALSRS